MVVKSQQEIVVAKAKTGMVCYDYKLKKIVSIPERALQSFK
jgi:acyl-CoA thioesterase FadM